MSPTERPDPTTEAPGVMHLDTDPSGGAALGVCTTSEAARLLDVSPTTVQVMVEPGALALVTVVVGPVAPVDHA